MLGHRPKDRPQMPVSKPPSGCPLALGPPSQGCSGSGKITSLSKFCEPTTLSPIEPIYSWIDTPRQRTTAHLSQYPHHSNPSLPSMSSNPTRSSTTTQIEGQDIDADAKLRAVRQL